MKRIIYPNLDNGSICIIIPSPDTNLTIEEIALQDVPKNLPYLIVDESMIPTDRTFRNAWIANFDNPDGYGEGL